MPSSSSTPRRHDNARPVPADPATHRAGPFRVACRWLAKQLLPANWIGLESRTFEWGIQIARILLVGGYMVFASVYDEWEQMRLVIHLMGAVMFTYTACFIVLLRIGRTRVVCVLGLILDPLVVGVAVLASAAVLDKVTESPFAMVGPGTAVPLIPAVGAALLRLRHLPGFVVAVLVSGGVGAGTAVLNYENPTPSLVVPRLLGMSTIGLALVGVSWSIQQVYRQLQLSIEDKLQLISTVVHELRGPVAALRTHLDLLQDDAVDMSPQQQRELIGNSVRSVTRIEQMIEVLAQVEQTESADLALDPKPLNLHTVALDVRQAMAQAAGDRGIAIKLVDLGLPLAWADRQAIEQVLSNLLSNAVKFSYDGGIVTIRGLDRSGDVGISVEDHGMAIPEQDQPHVFDRFYRGSDLRKREIGGAGLGLYISRSLVERNGGRLWLTSTSDGGSTFSFLLPTTGSRGASEAARRLSDGR